jgi:hypothetical protein
MKRWTYKTVELKPSMWGGAPPDLEQALNSAGMQGWELVSLLKTTRIVLVFKREG